jgi:hypothetical protein
MDFTTNNNYRKSVSQAENWQNIHNSNMEIVDNCSSFITGTCGEDISIGSVCCLYINGNIMLALAGDANRNYVVGLACHSAHNGQTVSIQTKGKFSSGISGLTPNSAYYSSTTVNGGLSTIDTDLYIGYSLSSTEIFLNIKLED